MRRIRALMAKANFKLDQAGALMEFVKAFIDDIWDGCKVVIIPQPGFSDFFNKFLKMMVGYLVALLMYKLKTTIKVPFVRAKDVKEPPMPDWSWMEGEQIPIGVAVDFEYDIRAGKGYTKLVGGPWDKAQGKYAGKTKIWLPGRKKDDSQAFYKFDGDKGVFVFSHLRDKEPGSLNRKQKGTVKK